MVVFGVTGGIASGKSFVASLLGELGATVLDADRHARAALDDPEVREALVDRWGDEIVDGSGALRRDQIARRVFASNEAATEERAFLEGLVHPRVRTALRKRLDEARGAGAPAAVLDVPLLYESGWDDVCDAVLFVDTPEPIRLERVSERGWAADELARRESAQKPIDEKRRLANAVIPGDDAEFARPAVADAWSRWVRSKDS